ncbi:hypothetical protein GGI09_008506, partial [Coemansia sp. S100]
GLRSRLRTARLETWRCLLLIVSFATPLSLRSRLPRGGEWASTVLSLSLLASVICVRPLPSLSCAQTP